ncbi:uncharacterized protein [Macrobrachium rosenbergii]|uniref:uncharacterized protein n=1 Tax=Macrobrachium rosenbergii TaxID=79674 RepID=UPI0034D5FDFF
MQFNTVLGYSISLTCLATLYEKRIMAEGSNVLQKFINGCEIVSTGHYHLGVSLTCNCTSKNKQEFLHFTRSRLSCKSVFLCGYHYDRIQALNACFMPFFTKMKLLCARFDVQLLYSMLGFME